MRISAVTVVAGVVGGLAWVVKFLVMVGQGGPESGSVAENISFALGLVALAVAAGMVGWQTARTNKAGLRVLAAIAGVIAFAGVQGIGQVALSALPGDSWVQEEAIFGVLGALAVLLAVVAQLRGRVDGPA